VIVGNWLGFGVVVSAALLFAPVPAGAQTTDDAIAVRDAIRAELARPGSGIPPGMIGVSNVRFEGDFATADVTNADSGRPIVFVRRIEERWQVVLASTEVTPGTCRYIGFPETSQMCRY